MSVFGWIIASLIALAVTVAYTFLVKIICNSVIANKSYGGFGVMDALTGGYTDPVATIITVFSGILSGLASISSILVFGLKISNNIPAVIVGMFIISIVSTIILFVVRYIQDEVVVVDDDVINVTSIILGIVFSLALIGFTVFTFVKGNETSLDLLFTETSIENVEKGQLREIHEKINSTITELNEVREEINNTTDKSLKKQLVKKESSLRKTLKKQNKEFKKEKRRIFVSENKVAILIFILSFVVIIFICMLLRIIFLKKRIKEIAIDIMKNIGDAEKIAKAQETVNNYETTIENFKNEIAMAQFEYQRENSESGLFNFGHKDRLEKASKKIENLKNEENEFKINNEETYSECKRFLKSLKKGTVNIYNKHKHDVYKCLEILQNEMVAAEAAEQQRLQILAEQQKRAALESVEKGRLEREASLAESQKIDKVENNIVELEEFIPVLQNHVSKEKNMDFQLLANLEKMLDAIEDLHDCIPENDMNNIERCQKKLLPLFDRCENKDEIQSDIEIITDSFSKILNK